MDFGAAESLSSTHTQIAGDGREPNSPVESLLCMHTEESSAPVESFVIVYNVSKRHNIGTLVRSATAFGVSEIILVGRHKDFNAFGSHGAAAHLRYRHFFTLADARSHLKEKGCDIIGVEIVDGAMPVHSHPFARSTAFLLGNEGSGLSDREMAICDSFVYIAQYGSGTASLNVTVAASIVLHHFAVWAGLPERPREGHKFVVAEPPPRQMHRVVYTETPEMVAEMRRSRKGSFGDWLRDVEQDGDTSQLDRSGQGLVSTPLETSSALSRLFDE